MAAASLLAACSKDDGITDAIDNNPETGSGTTIENPVATGYTTYVEVATESGDSRATYDSTLQPLWEEGDKIAIHQMSAVNGGSEANKSELPIKEGAGTSEARFGDEITLPTAEKRYFCFAYPAAAAAFSTSDEIAAVGAIDYTYHQTSPGIGHYTATGTYKHIYTSSCNITIPTEQGGKWEPYMYAFTDESKPADNLGSFKFNTLNGAICLRVKDTDGATPKQLKEIIIRTLDHQPIAGTFKCNSSCEGILEPLTGDNGKTGSTVANDDGLRADARAKLEDKARAASPAATTQNVVSAPSLSEGHYEITVSGLENIAPNEDGEYLYYINVAPVTTSGLEIILKDTHDFECMRTTGALTLEASHRKGYNIKWDEDVIAVAFDEEATGKLATSYSDYLAGDSAAANGKDAYTIYDAAIKGKITMQGKYKLSDIGEYGLCVEEPGDNADKYTHTFPANSALTSTALELSLGGNLTGMKLGEYVYYIYVKDNAGNILATTDHLPLYITGLPYMCNVSQNDGWAQSGSVSFHSSYIELLHHENPSSSIEREFYAPADINVTANSTFGVRNGTGYSITFHLYVSGNEVYSQKSQWGSEASGSVKDKATTLKSTNTKVQLTNTDSGSTISSYNYTRIYSFALQYGNK